MIASLDADWLKLRKRPANWVLFLVLIGTLLTFAYILSYVIFTHPPSNFNTQGGPPPSVLKRSTFPENLIPAVLQDLIGFGTAIALIMGALSAGNEYSWATMQTILVQRPNRVAVFLGKVSALALVVVLLVAAVFAAAAAASFAIVQVDGSRSAFPPVSPLLRAAGAAWLILATWTAFGVVLAVLFRGVAGSIGAGLTYLFVVEALLANLFRGVSGFKEVLRFLPGVNGSGLVAAFASTVRQRGQTIPLVSPGRGAVTLAVYLVAFIVVSALIVRRRDLG